MRALSADIIVVGAGAAGILAAAFAAGEGRRVLLLERTRDGGRKILISGGGRCNILPSEVDPAWFVSDSSPHSLRKILRSWPLAAQRRFFDAEVGIPLVLEEETGKLFPASQRARDVRDRLLVFARERGASIRFEATLEDVRPDAGAWVVLLAGGEELRSHTVVLATGGLSVPTTGSDGTGLGIAAKLGHRVSPTYPALTPLTTDAPRFTALAGVSLEVALTSPPVTPRYNRPQGFLFTHRGFSGPVVLNISHIAVRSRMQGGPRQPILVRWSPLERADWDAELGSPSTTAVRTVIRRHLPSRLADALADEAGLPPDRTLAQLRREERQDLVRILTAFTLPWAGDEGYRKAEVTGGGVTLDEVDPVTLESRRCPGLFMCGEMLDAFGPIGGFNFLWAWATGRAAGLGARARAA
ncbi:MAG TPA: aminoacetone oxidase family FAD-binding enzyme [Gemmatimonadales bacterium]|nr:aminoacetone oxidase family FAD-binding enzyme [Gemmatimonadales bacterium]